MTHENSPFTPGYPVPIEFFVGRKSQIDLLLKKIISASTGRLQIAFLCGERGIGKSSLAYFVKILSERNHHFVGIHNYLGGVTSLTVMVRRILDNLLNESVDKAWHEKIIQSFKNHVKRVGLFGVSLELDIDPKDLDHTVNNFAPTLHKISDQLKTAEKKGLLVILDDINGLASSAEFAHWIKSLVDTIATSDKNIPLCLLLVGLEERRQSLVKLQPSLSRVFDIIDIAAWSDDESKEFFSEAFSKVNVDIEQKALENMVFAAGGLPVMAHEIGDAVFNIDKDNYIDGDDAYKGIFNAADIVGRKHLEPQVFKAIQSKKYRSILKKVATKPFGFEFQRKEVIEILGRPEEKVFDNFLTRMTELGVIIRSPEKGKGYYKFRNLLHYLYFLITAGKTKNTISASK
ncbi:MAG: hypothetical protein AMJ79_07015 [Phycisphaerae bacterium SM23_30]|nr:MAG: hypothetical protein AMJ79_07015 [Phycisphaerae bacterium SM23_30]